MKDYCKQDVILLEKVFKKLRPEAIGLPNFNLMNPYKEKVCPKCGSSDPLTVGLLVLTHLLVRDNHGPIRGAAGLRWKFACDPKRAVLATETNLEAATGVPSVANCPGCLAALAADDKRHFSQET
jgi:hypothetical protein